MPRVIIQIIILDILLIFFFCGIDHRSYHYQKLGDGINPRKKITLVHNATNAEVDLKVTFEVLTPLFLDETKENFTVSPRQAFFQMTYVETGGNNNLRFSGIFKEPVHCKITDLIVV